MSTHRKHWSTSEKLEIINFFDKHGPVRTSREFGVSVTSIYNWKSKFESDGEAGLSIDKQVSRPMEKEELLRLRRENQQLKNLVAEKELRLRIQEEMLKKSR